MVSDLRKPSQTKQSGVLILVLMEDGLGPYVGNSPPTLISLVLILVLMEDGLGHSKKLSKLGVELS